MEHKLTKIDIITRSSKLEALKEALNEIGVLGMTVSQVYGCGLQKGHKEVYRGKEYDINLVPKIKVETVVCEIPVEKVLETAQRVLRTGKFGDGKIFVYELTDAVRIRTGHRGVEAIMDIPGEKPER
ncbi:MAG: P-II family nitrogen regulator [Selenomonadaceae bacterium]|nr:P-II family nitrogen regulator [Selenomonadaceae bacterium]MBR1858332.1 P-II family nitrogen regulator [Selenomonadaceae bacterium]